MLRTLSVLTVLYGLMMGLRAEDLDARPEADSRAAAPKLKSPSNLKFNSTTGTSKVFAPAPAGQALTADGTGFFTKWAYIKGTNIDSNPASSGMVLTSDGNGKATWAVIPFSILSGTVSNSQLDNPSFTLNAGTGLTGGGAVSLGGAQRCHWDRI